MKLDPTISVAIADMQASHDLQMKLREMQSNMNVALRFLDSVKEQLKHTQTTMKTLTKEPDEQMTKALEDYIKEIDTMQDRLAARNEGLGFSGRAQVSDDIANLFFSLDGNVGPTAGQRAYFGEFQPVYRTRMDEVNKFSPRDFAGMERKTEGLECTDADNEEALRILGL